MTQPSEEFQGAAQSSYGIPMVVEQTKNGERGYDLVSRLMKDSVVMVQGPIHQQMAGIIVAQLLFLGAQNKGRGADGAISMYIDSPGGEVDAGMAIYDAMNYVQAEYGIPVRTIGIGQNASMGSFLLCVGTRGYRSMMPNSNHMVHQPSAGTGGKVSDMAIRQDAVEETKQRMALLYAAHTNMTYDEAKALGDRDSFLRAEECLSLGIVDKISYPDSVVARNKTGDNPVEYAEGVEEHLARISKIQREINQSAMENRRKDGEERGPHTALVKRLSAEASAKPAP